MRFSVMLFKTDSFYFFSRGGGGPGGGGGGAVAPLVERATPVEEVLGSNFAVATRSLLVESVSV